MRNHASDPGLINAVLQKIVELRAIGHRHQTQLDWYRRRWSLLVHLPPLFAEMFDIPRSEEDLAWNRNERVTSLNSYHLSFFFLLGISNKNRKDIKKKRKISFLLFMIDIILSNLGLFIFQRFSITHPWILFLKSSPNKFEGILWPAIALRPIYWNWFIIISLFLYLTMFLSIDFFLSAVHLIIYQIFKKEKKLWSTTIIWNFLLYSQEFKLSVLALQNIL